REQQRDEAELDGDRQALDKQCRDRYGRLDRRAEVALGDLSDVGPELDRDRLVEALPVVEVRALLDGRALAEEGIALAARQHATQKEDEEEQPEQHRDREQDPPDDERCHSDRSISGGGRRGAATAAPLRADGRGRSGSRWRWIEESTPQGREVVERAGVADVV